MSKWTDKEKKRIRKIWEKSGKDSGKFKKMCQADPLLKKKGGEEGWRGCEHFARSAGFFKEEHVPAAITAIEKLEKEDPEKVAAIKLDLADASITWDDIKERYGYTSNQLKRFIEKSKVTVNKSRPVQVAAKDQPITEQQLIKKREAGEISIVDFLNGLVEVKSEYADYWKVISEVMQKQRFLRVKDLLPFAKKLNAKHKEEKYRLNFIAGILRKFDQWQVLFSLKSDKSKGDRFIFYLCNLPAFYSPEEAYKLVSESEQQRIAAHITKEPSEISTIVKLLYGDEERGTYFLGAFLSYYQSFGLISYDRKAETYCLTPRGMEWGVDAQSIKTLEAEALENALFVKQEESGELPKSLDEVGAALERDIANKTVPVMDLAEELKEDDLKILFLGEVLYGSQYTDQKLLDWVLGISNPTLTVASGLVQGRFEVRNKHKTKMLVEESGLHKIENQYHSAGMLLDWLERITTSRVCMIQGDDDFRMAEDYGTLAFLAEGKNPWKWGVDWSSFSSEMERRLQNRELRRKIRIQWEIIQSYMYRIGRSLFNREEVKAKIGVAKNEYRLIIEIMVAKRKGFDYPEEYEKVVNVPALFGNIGKRIVTPDPLRLLVAPDKEIRLVHNAGFSDITQYLESNQHLDATVRHLGLARQKVPYVLADFHQESLSLQYIQGTWVMNLPGMQNTLPAYSHTMQEWHTKILESKERRQSRVRKEPVSPSATEITFCQDGRTRIRILNNAIRRIIEEQKNEPEQKAIGLLGTDVQFGSITAWPEFTAKFFDYGLYERKAQYLWMNGDIIHGLIYPQFNAENRPLRLTTLHSQQRFCFELLLPLILNAPNLKDLTAWLGNHEWNNMSAKYQGDNPLSFLEMGLLAVLKERERAGTKSSLQRAMNISRIRWKDTHNPQGDIINWPFYADTICGFKVAIQHMWQPFHGKNPTKDFKSWLKNMAERARSIDILLGGHLHCIWMAELADKIIVQSGAGASESGYDIHFGLFSTVMYTLVEFSNKEGLTVEFVPWQFLANYKFQCPDYQGKDNEFVRPGPGTEGYKQGKTSPFIENLIDNLTGYLEV